MSEENLPIDAPTTERQPVYRALIMTASLMIVLYGLHWGAAVFVPIVVAFFLAVLSYPVMRFLTSKRVPHFLAMLLTVALNIAILAGLVNVASTLIVSFQGHIPRYVHELQKMMADGALWLEGKGVKGASDAVEKLDWSAIFQYAGTQNMMKMLNSTWDLLSSMVKEITLILILLLFILGEARGVTSRVLAVQQAGGPDLTKLLASASDIQKYLGIKTVISAIGGVLCGIWCWGLGLDYALLWGILAFLLHFIPAFGAILAGILPTLLALVQFGPGSAIAVAVGYLIINFALGSLIEPTMMGRRFGVSPLVILLSVLFWGMLWDAVGMFLAVPLTIMLKVVLENTDEFRWLGVAMSKKKVVKGGEIILETDALGDAEMIGGGAATEPPH